ncbi:hypothetical protein SM124_09190 [Bacillus sp. 31A1R]|uniref:Uncharacterized protein n=1 Tax=Robertmurraya mangrovi TaxID=3098077 RepID=A0ABU5IXR9_9BACI|nr:hypothetical protein [Bacillus sp. 31A1R]MDZ5471921.1 hypothetical protein [Bacillus sp. 31A1R]
MFGRIKNVFENQEEIAEEYIVSVDFKAEEDDIEENPDKHYLYFY